MAIQPFSSGNISLWHIAGFFLLTQALTRNDGRGADYTTLFGHAIEGISVATRNIIHDFPIITFAGGLTYFAHQLIPATHQHLSLSITPGMEGSLKVATFVIGVFALKAGLSVYLQKAFNDKVEEKFNLEKGRKPRDGEEKRTEADLIREGLIYNFLPLAIGIFGAYYFSIPLKLARIALYTAGMIGLVRLMGKGVDYILADEKVKAIFQTTYGWLNLESSLSQPPPSPTKK